MDRRSQYNYSRKHGLVNDCFAFKAKAKPSRPRPRQLPEPPEPPLIDISDSSDDDDNDNDDNDDYDYDSDNNSYRKNPPGSNPVTSSTTAPDSTWKATAGAKAQAAHGHRCRREVWKSTTIYSDGHVEEERGEFVETLPHAMPTRTELEFEPMPIGSRRLRRRLKGPSRPSSTCRTVGSHSHSSK